MKIRNPFKDYLCRWKDDATKTEKTVWTLFLVYFGLLWFIMVFNGIEWYTMVYNGIQWYTMVYNGIKWYTMVYKGI